MKYKNILKKYGVTQEELAKRLGLNRVTIARTLSEENDPRESTIRKIASAIGCDVAELFQDPNTPEENGKAVIYCPHCGKTIQINITTKD